MLCSRVWIIQELLLPPYAIIPIHHVEFTAWPDSIARISATHEKWNWNDTRVSWLQYLLNPPSDFGKDLIQVIRHTKDSQSTDPRDTVFGVLGLIQDSQLAQDLSPDYTISNLHMWIGICGHLLLVQRNHIILQKALGRTAPTSVPSWLPRVGHRESLTSTPTLSWHFDVRNSYGWFESILSGHNIMRSVGLFKPTIGIQYSNYGPGGMPFTWDFHPSIDPISSSLSIHLLQMFSFSPAQVVSNFHENRQDNRRSVCELVVKQSHLCFYTPNPINFDGEKGTIDIFVLVDDRESLLLLMRKTKNACSYSLMEVLPFTYFVHQEHLTLDNDDRKLTIGRYDISDPDVALPLNRYALGMTLYSLLDHNYLAFEEIGSKRNNVEWSELCLLLPRNEWRKEETMTILQTYLDTESHARPNFEAMFVATLLRWKTESGAAASGGFYKLTVSSEDWPSTIFVSERCQQVKKRLHELGNSLGRFHFWEWSLAEQPGSVTTRKWNDCIGMEKVPESSLIELRMSVDGLFHWLNDHKTIQFLREIRFHARFTGENETTMVSRGPRYEDRLIGHFNWGQGMIDNFQASGVVKKVLII